MLASNDPRDPHTANPRVTHLTISAESWRALARRRRTAARLALPVFAGLTVAVLAFSLSLMLLAVICGFMTYACVVLAAQAGRADRDASDQTFTLEGPHLAGPPPRRVQLAIFRRDHVRLLLGEHTRLTSLDLPLTPTQRDTLRDALHSAGVRIDHDSPLRRALTLLLAPLAALLALVILKAALGLTAVLTLAAWPWTAAVLLAVVLAAWLVRRAR